MRQQFAKKLTILVVLILAAVVVWLSSSYGKIKAFAIEKNKTDTVAYIQKHLAALVKPEDFSDKNPARQQQVFQAFFDTIQSPQLVRIKVWDRNFNVIWSNLSELIGQRFPDNHEVQEALEGNVEFEIEKQKSEHFSERQYDELSETYVPIPNPNKDIIGVIEVYQPTSPLYDEINAQFRKVVIQSFGVVLVASALLALLFRLILNKAG